MKGAKYFVSVISLAALIGCSIKLPEAPATKQTMWAEQGWTNDERYWYHHASQGTNTFVMPFEWLNALEQPEFSFSEVGLLLDQKYLSRFGFIPSPPTLADKKSAARYGYVKETPASKYYGKEYNAADLPVGFVVGSEWFDSANGRYWPIAGTGENAQSIGFTCAACHTGQLEYGDYRVLVDGGPAMVDLGKFRKAMKLSLAFTKNIPGRFDRFAKRVLGDAYNSENSKALKEQFDNFLAQAKQRADLEKSVSKRSVEEGFTRLDALNRIGNEVFAEQMRIGTNIYPTSGPVIFPTFGMHPGLTGCSITARYNGPWCVMRAKPWV